MNWQWSAGVLAGAAATLLLAALAVLVYAARPRSRVHRWSSLLIVMVAFGWALPMGLLALAADETTIRFAVAVAMPWQLAVPAVLFCMAIAQTLGGGLVRRAAYVAVAVVAAAAQATWFASPRVVIDVASQGGDRFAVAADAGFWAALATCAAAATAAASFLVSGERGPRRYRAWLFTSLAGGAAIALLAAVAPSPWIIDDRGLAVASVLVTVPTGGFAVGLLRGTSAAGREFLRRTVAGGLVATVLTAVFFGVSEGLETLVPFTDVTLTIVAAAAIALVMRPLEGRAERLTDRLVPPRPMTADQEERWRTYRRAADAAWEDGVLQRRDRVLLGALQERLGLPDRIARWIEQTARRKHAAMART